jgi:NAD(P)-dependent dehydrogenase (short-subunit alcohol dehydrogenase family)
LVPQRLRWVLSQAAELPLRIFVESNMRTLQDKVIVITGASRGIGAAIARAFASEKCKLVLCGRDRSQLGQVADSCALPAGNVVTVVADVRTYDGIKTIVATALERFGRIDIFVNNAGIGFRRWVSEMSEAEFDDTIATNLKAVFFSFQELIPRFRAQGGGQIINVSSMIVKQGSAEYPVYAASKAALNTLSESVAAEVRNDNIRVCVFAPGTTGTDFGGTPLAQKAPRPRMSTDETAEAVLFLAKQDGHAWISTVEMRPLKTQ